MDEKVITETNPYVPPNTHGKLNEATEDHRPARGWGTILWSLAYFYPVLSTACIYSSWLTACICLGRMPRPMLDDPKSIGGIVDAAYMLSMIAILTAPIMIPLCFFFVVDLSTQFSSRTRYASGYTWYWLHRDHGWTYSDYSIRPGTGIGMVG